MTDLNTILIAFGYIGFVILCATLLPKFVTSSKEVTRKFIHIMVGNWVFLYPLYETFWGLVFVPALFIIINTLSLKFTLIKAMEREENDGYGTVYYAISLSVLAALAYLLNSRYILTIGILCMAYGDGFAAIIGKKYGSNLKFKMYPTKSLPGSLVVAGVAFGVTTFSLILEKTSTNIIAILAIALVVSVFAVFLELEGKQGIDNITLPMGTSLLAYLSFQNPSIMYFIVVIVLLVIFLLAYKKRAITVDGIMMGMIVGLTIYTLSGMSLLLNLVAFFILGSVISKIQNSIKREAEMYQEHTGARNWVQVCANALPQTLIVTIVSFYPQLKDYEILAYALFATAFADTFASELGMLSKGKVISITNFKPIPVGASGGVSIIGTLAGLLGAFISSLFAISKFGAQGMMFVLIMGFIGMIIDSILGDLIQRKYTDASGNYRDIMTLKDGRLKGLAFISNNTVNVMSLIIILVIGVITL